MTGLVERLPANLIRDLRSAARDLDDENLHALADLYRQAADRIEQLEKDHQARGEIISEMLAGEKLNQARIKELEGALEETEILLRLPRTDTATEAAYHIVHTALHGDCDHPEPDRIILADGGVKCGVCGLEARAALKGGSDGR